MKWMIAAGVSALLLSGCASVPSTRYNSDWQGRPVRDVIEHFGVPSQFGTVPDRQWVVLVYSRDTSYTVREAQGTFTGPKDGRLVHEEYWGDVTYNSNCEIRVAIDRARTVAQFAMKGSNCGSLTLKPTKQ